MTDFSIEALQQWRADTPGAANRIHLNNAGAALMPRPVLDAMTEHLELEMSIGGYEAAAAMRRETEAFYESVAALIGAQPHQIAFTTSATDGYNKALSAIPFERGDVLLTTTDDYVSNQIAFLQLARRFGVRVIRAANRPEGGLDVKHLAKLLDQHRPRLVAVTHVPTNSGLVQPVAEIGALCRERRILYLVDACQSAGQLHLDVEALHCDFLSATFRKFLRGPRGAGFLYVSDRVLADGLEPLFLDLHSANWSAANDYEPRSDARRFELWERPHALVLGGRAAADYAVEVGARRIEARVRQLAAQLREALQHLDEVRVLDTGPDLCGIVTFHVPGRRPGRLKAALEQRRINTSLTTLESARLDFEAKGVDWALRASPHYYNSAEELNAFVEILQDLLAHP
jgi:selenocysteine lyase/cysteine desulfurase